MRSIRWVIGGVVAAAVLVLAIGPFVGGASSCPTVSLTAPNASFIGEVVAEHAGAVTFRVDEVLPDRIFHDVAAAEVAVGDEVVVHYRGGDERFVHQGQSYQVDAWGHVPDELASGVHTADECAGGGTVHADGSPIDTGLWTRDGIAPYQGRIALGALVLAVGVVGAIVHRRVSHPRLTIDGHPRH
ncbi:MAG: hypothetical protein ACXWBN_02455 [Acidimicrobiales bacterium]